MPQRLSDYSNRLIIVIPAARKDQANTLAAQIDVAGGINTFRVGLYPIAGPFTAPTHYWCSWVMTDAERAAIVQRVGGNIPARPGWVYDAEIYTPQQVLDELGLTPNKPIVLPAGLA